MSTFPLLMSLADELDNLTTRSYLDDFGLGFYPHRHYHRVPSLSLPSEEEWAEQQQYQQRRNSRSRKYSEPPIKEQLEQKYELQNNTIETTKTIFNTVNHFKKNDKNDISIKSEIDSNSSKNNIDELRNLKTEREKNSEQDVENVDGDDDEKQDYDGYISKHTTSTSSYSSNDKYDFPKLEKQPESNNKLIKNFKVKKLNLQSKFKINKKNDKEQLKRCQQQQQQQQQSSQEKLDNNDGNNYSNISPEEEQRADCSKEPNT